jgi:hypothetical protein
VNVPADWPADKDIVWTLTANGTTLKAFGSLWPVWEIDEQTMSANNGGRTARTFGEPVNLAPSIVGQLPRTEGGRGQPLTLVLPAKDDGCPRRKFARVERAVRGNEQRRRARPLPIRSPKPLVVSFA